MNCDQAFDVMTSSDRLSDRGLHAHMADCPRCRDMRETLEPAIRMLSSDSVNPRDMQPWITAPEGCEIATHAAKRSTTSGPAQPRGLTGLWRY